MKNCRTIGYPYLGILLIAFLGMSSCYELPSDEEIKTDILGKWQEVYCSYPYSSDPYNQYPFPGGTIVFRSDGSFVQQNHAINRCRDSCGIDSISTSVVSNYCTCTWVIENGSIIIRADSSLHHGYFDLPFPILRIDDDCLILDKLMYNGHQVEENACFTRP